MKLLKDLLLALVLVLVCSSFYLDTKKEEVSAPQSSPVIAPPETLGYSQDQVKLLNMAKMSGEGIGWPETIQSLLLVESTAGKFGRIGDDGKAVGVMQTWISTAQYTTANIPTLPSHPRFRTEQLLFENDQYSIVIGSLYFKRCMDIFGNWRRAVVCYNTGIKGARAMTAAEVNDHPYLAKVRKALHDVRDFRLAKLRSNQVATNDSRLGVKSQLQSVQFEKADDVVLRNVVHLLHDGSGSNVGRSVQPAVYSLTRPIARSRRLRI